MSKEKTPVSDLLGISIEKIKEMADVNAIIGEPIKLADGTTIIPVSKVSYGFASGGSDLPSKYDKDLFGGGTGAGVSVSPIAFIVISNGDAKVLTIDPPNTGVAEKALAMAPDVIEKIKAMFTKDDKEKSNETTDTQTTAEKKDS